LAWNGRASTVPEQALGLSSIVSLSHTRKPSSRPIDHLKLLAQALIHDDTLPIFQPEENSLRPAKVKSDEESTEPEDRNGNNYDAAKDLKCSPSAGGLNLNFAQV